MRSLKLMMGTIFLASSLGLGQTLTCPDEDENHGNHGNHGGQLAEAATPRSPDLVQGEKKELPPYLLASLNGELN